MRGRTLRLAGGLAAGVGLAVLAACASSPPSPEPARPGPPERSAPPPYRRLRPPVAYEMMRDTPDLLILDLRPAGEFNGPTGHLRRAQNIPLAELPQRWSELNPFRDDTFLVYCHDDPCVQQGLTQLREHGFDGAVQLVGGIDAWIRAGFRTVLPPGVIGRPGRSPAPQIDAAGALRPLRPNEKPVHPSDDVPQGPPPPR